MHRNVQRVATDNSLPSLSLAEVLYMERRAHPRVQVSHPVLFFTDIYARPKVARTVDLSLGGIRIETPYTLNRGEGLEIIIAIDPKAINLRGKVIYVLPLGNGTLQVGIQFEELPERDRLCLRQYLFHVMERQAI